MVKAHFYKDIKFYEEGDQLCWLCRSSTASTYLLVENHLLKMAEIFKICSRCVPAIYFTTLGSIRIELSKDEVEVYKIMET